MDYHLLVITENVSPPFSGVQSCVNYTFIIEQMVSKGKFESGL